MNNELKVSFYLKREGLSLIHISSAKPDMDYISGSDKRCLDATISLLAFPALAISMIVSKFFCGSSLIRVINSFHAESFDRSDWS